MKRIFSIYLAVLLSVVLMAQTPSTAYHTDNFVLRHELNPAFQPDSNYMSLPLMGNTSVTIGSSLPMKYIIFNMPSDYNKLTLFTTKGTIGKSELLDKVSDGMTTSVDARLTLFSIGYRLESKHYRTIEASFRTQASAYVPRELFLLLKDVENGSYNVDGLNLSASSFLDLSIGESYQYDRKLTFGGKAKLLIGLVNVNASIENFNVNIDAQSNWTIQGNVSADVAGMEYETKNEEYNNRINSDGTQETYEMVNGLKFGKLGVHGIGVALDGGMEYKCNEHFALSASVRDLGFITWFNSSKAGNSGEMFEFEGFKNVSKDGDATLKHQWNILKDDMLDMIHLEEKGSGNYQTMLNCILSMSAKYNYNRYSTGCLIQGCTSWMEARLNLGVMPVKSLDVVVSPTYGTYGFSVGGMVNYHHKGFSVFLASDRLFFEVNRQMIPTSLNAGVQFGMTFPL